MDMLQDILPRLYYSLDATLAFFLQIALLELH